jgi:hypothetical protein
LWLLFLCIFPCKWYCCIVPCDRYCLSWSLRLFFFNVLCNSFCYCSIKLVFYILS